MYQLFLKDIMEIVYKILKNKPFLILSLLTLGYRLPFLFVPLDRDEGGYAYMGWLWTTGKAIPYLQSFDHKFPPVFLIYGLASLLGGNNFISIRVLQFVYFFLIFIVFYFFCLKIAGRLAAFLATFLMVIYLSSIRLEGGNFNTEMLFMLPLLIATFLIWKLKGRSRINLAYVFILGLISSLTSLFKPVAFLPIAGIFLWLLSFQRKINIVLLPLFFIAGFLLPIILIFIYFNNYHAILSLIENLVDYNQQYNKAGLWILTASVSDGGGMLNIINWLKTTPEVLGPFLILSLVTLYWSKKSRSYLWWVGLIYIVSSWIGAKLGGTREFPHYYLPMALALSFCSLLLFERLINQKKRIVAILITLFLAGWVVFPEIQILTGGPLAILRGEFGSAGYWFNDAEAVSNWIINNTNKQDSLLVWANEPEIYFYSRKKSLTEHINFYSFFYRPPMVKENWLKGVKDSPPRWIITYINDPPSYKELVQLFPDMIGYSRVAEIGMYTIFQRINKFSPMEIK